MNVRECWKGSARRQALKLKTPVANTYMMQLCVVGLLGLNLVGCVKPPDRAEIFASGVKYYNERNYIQAEKKFEESLKLFAEKDGGSTRDGNSSKSGSSLKDGTSSRNESSPDISSNEMYLANTRWELGKFKEAIDMHKAAMASMTKQYGADSEQVADAELRLGIDAYSMNDKKATKTHYENSLAIVKKHLPKTQIKVKQLQSKIKALADNK